MTSRLVITADGSASIFVEELDEHYHSIHGALQESLHVFIHAGLHQRSGKQELAVLEIGFGTGLNALLTCIEADRHHQEIHYTAIEKYPLAEPVYTQLNYCTLLDANDCNTLFSSIHSGPWETAYPVSENFSLLKLKMNIEDISFTDQFDLIYFDAFAPSAQPELWTAEIFHSMYNALKPGGILVTYCAKGEVKRRMKSAGFKIEALPGPKGKREMTRAIK